MANMNSEGRLTLVEIILIAALILSAKMYIPCFIQIFC